MYAETPVYLDAELVPNKSLSPRAVAIVLVIVGICSFLGGFYFLQLGAFPVVGFFGLDALAVWWAFRVSTRDQRQSTHVRVTGDTLVVDHTTPKGEVKSVELPTPFVRVSLEHQGKTPRGIRLSLGREAYIIGRFLAPEDCESFVEALNAAISKARTERYAS